MANARQTSSSIANCSNYGITILKSHGNSFFVYELIENRWLSVETNTDHYALALLI